MTTTTTTTLASATATTPRAQASTILSLLTLHPPFSQPRPCLAILVVPPPFLARASLARHRAFSRVLSRVLPLLPPSRSIRSLCTICLPFSVSNTTHGPPGGLVRGSILTAGVARTPILSVPANRRVSSKVSLHLLRRPSSSGHPRVTLHNHLHHHPLWPPYSTTLRLTPSMSSVTRPWRVSPSSFATPRPSSIPRTPTSTPFRSFFCLDPAVRSRYRESRPRRLLSREKRAATRSKITGGDGREGRRARER